jgi:hypothetical protein
MSDQDETGKTDERPIVFDRLHTIIPASGTDAAPAGVPYQVQRAEERRRAPAPPELARRVPLGHKAWTLTRLSSSAYELLDPDLRSILIMRPVSSELTDAEMEQAAQKMARALSGGVFSYRIEGAA